ncbi:MAG: hypothetical protein RTV31_14890 [Candidatus Thorarchaeota archaeon]
MVYAIVIPLIVFILPPSEIPQTTAPTIITQVFLFLMPFELLLVYVLYRVFSNKIDSKSIVGIALLMYIVSLNPSVLAFVIGFTDSFSRNLGVLVGLIFSLSGLILSWVLISRHLGEDDVYSYAQGN